MFTEEKRRTVISWFTDFEPNGPLLPPQEENQRPPGFDAVVIVDMNIISERSHIIGVGDRRDMLPGAEAFFQLFPYYELVLWNSDEATMMGMESAEKLDPYHTAQRLFQEHITVREGKPFKNLDILGRPKSRVIVIGKKKEECLKHPDNIITVDGINGINGLHAVVKVLKVLAVDRPHQYRQDLRDFVQQLEKIRTEINEEFEKKKEAQRGVE